MEDEILKRKIEELKGAIFDLVEMGDLDEEQAEIVNKQIAVFFW